MLPRGGLARFDLPAVRLALCNHFWGGVERALASWRLFGTASSDRASAPQVTRRGDVRLTVPAASVRSSQAYASSTPSERRRTARAAAADGPRSAAGQARALTGGPRYPRSARSDPGHACRASHPRRPQGHVSDIDQWPPAARGRYPGSPNASSSPRSDVRAVLVHRDRLGATGLDISGSALDFLIPGRCGVSITLIVQTTDQLERQPRALLAGRRRTSAVSMSVAADTVILH